VIAGAQQLTTEEVAGASGGPAELPLAGSGGQDAVATDPADDLLLTDDNVENLKKELEAHKEQLREQTKAHQGKPLLPSGTCIV
jgi:hypothetical protein